MGRFVFLVLFLAACPKKEKEAELEPLGSGAPPSGRSVTKIAEGGAEDGGNGSGEGGDGSGRLSNHTNKPTTPKDAGVAGAKPDASLYGGNGAPPYIDDEGHLHGPGGPLFMGKGVECNGERDHCMRDGVWFAVGNLVAGKLYRATPIFQYEGKWYNWRGREETYAMRFKTKVGTKDTLRAGDPVIWFIDENSNRKFVDNEYDALTSSRWEAGVIDIVMPEKIRVKGWTYGAVPIDTTRVIVEQK